MPPRINAIATRHLRDATRIRIAPEHLPDTAVPQVRQLAYIVARAHKPAALSRVLDMESPEAAIIFCGTRNEVDELTGTVNAHGYRAEALHGGMSQDERDRVMKKLRGGAVDLLVATDVAARGLDIPRLTHVINYDAPNAPEAYVHRIGRVGRAGREGVAITLAQPREHRLLKSFEQLTKRKIEVGKVPTVADLRARRLELVRASLRETLLTDHLDRFRVVVESLGEEFDLMDIAMAAVKMAQDTSGGEGNEEEDIPDATVPKRPAREQRSAGRKGSERRGEGRQRRTGTGLTRLFIGAGRDAGIRPGDLVGVITGEAGLAGRDIGAIDIAERFSIVEVAEDAAGEVIDALRNSRIKGRKTTVRRDRRKG